jgi:4-hydroxy-3-methylbut-2-en-1-yl diphosphate reductase
MRVIRAEVLGMCFGVRDALKAMGRVADPSSVTVHGELVHNEVVLEDLAARGFQTVAESDRDALPETPNVLITAHGVSDRERTRLQSAGKHLIDTTCPLVRRAHEAALKLRDEGRHVLVIGKQGHVEVRGLVEDLPSHDVIEREDDVKTYPHDRLGVICQTTTTEGAAGRLRQLILDRNPAADIRFIDTVCLPTKDHQRALERLIDQVDAVVVVGGWNSNNTRALATRAAERGRPTVHVRGPSDLDPSWFRPEWTVGLTAGTSTLDRTIVEVHMALLTIAGRLEFAEAVS